MIPFDAEETIPVLLYFILLLVWALFSHNTHCYYRTSNINLLLYMSLTATRCILKLNPMLAIL